MKKKPLSDNPTLFADSSEPKTCSPGKDAPLAVRMRPRSIDEVLGQEHLLAEGKLLQRAIQTDRWSSILFYGPTGSGKTTLAELISRMTQSRFVRLNAVASNVATVRVVIDEAIRYKTNQGRRTIVFIDEIHRFNKAQQDVLMPDVEEGNIVLIGATTHNPSFAINGPLLSRSLIFELRPLSESDLVRVMERALQDPERGFGKWNIRIEKSALAHIARNAAGDARRALNALEVGVLTTPPDPEGVIHFNEHVAQESCQRKIVYYDGDEDYHYDTISAFIKSMRHSDPDAAIYWLAKMLYAGEDPRFIVRRILIFASEDIGNADPQALILAASGLSAVEFVGMPESQIILGHLVTYMSLAPKSKASYFAIQSALEDVKRDTVQEVPTYLRDSHYPGAKQLGHGKFADKIDDFMPHRKSYYKPSIAGFEETLALRLKKHLPLQ